QGETEGKGRGCGWRWDRFPRASHPGRVTWASHPGGGRASHPAGRRRASHPTQERSQHLGTENLSFRFYHSITSRKGSIWFFYNPSLTFRLPNYLLTLNSRNSLYLSP